LVVADGIVTEKLVGRPADEPLCIDKQVAENKTKKTWQAVVAQDKEKGADCRVSVRIRS
jgi:hypothetical protein